VNRSFAEKHTNVCVPIQYSKRTDLIPGSVLRDLSHVLYTESA